MVHASPEDSGVEEASAAPRELGVERYVHVAFFGLGLLAAFLAGKVLLMGWNSLADWPAAVRSLPALISYTEDERANFTLVIGAVLGVLVVLRYYRRPAVRSWAMEVASELSRVTWPDREMVTNGTLIVLIAGAVATVYVTLLDRFWGYLTNLVYGA
jgi:preprotein translocase subunit SecE